MKYRILLIEDNRDIRENTAEILELSNYIVDAAENGKAGVEMALLQKPDLIICDIMMPVLDGYGVLHLINKHETLAAVPFIFLTAKSDRSDLRMGMEMGADDYITKPFTDIELLNAIDIRLKKIDQLKKEYSSDPEGLLAMIDEYGGKNAMQELIANRQENIYPKKQLVYKEGNHPKKLFYLKKGKVKTYLTSDDGKGLTVGLFGEGDFFGYTALLEGGVYKESAEAIDDALVAEVPVDEFQKILRYNHEALEKFIQLLAKNITEKEKQLLNIAYNSMRKRVAITLLTLLEKYSQKEEKEFSINISREDLANIAGTATESLIRTLSDFKSEKLISIKGSEIVILNQSKLEEMMN